MQLQRHLINQISNRTGLSNKKRRIEWKKILKRQSNYSDLMDIL